jgi:hypothetical protein
VPQIAAPQEAHREVFAIIGMWQCGQSFMARRLARVAGRVKQFCEGMRLARRSRARYPNKYSAFRR